MAIASSTLPDLSVLDHEALKSLGLAQQTELLAQHELLAVRDSQIEHLYLMIIQLRRMQFGPKSEKLEADAAIYLALDQCEAVDALPRVAVKSR